MTKEQQEKEVKELAKEIAEATAKGAYTSKELAQHLISKGYRKAGELTVISDEEIAKLVKKAREEANPNKVESLTYLLRSVAQAQCDHDQREA